MAIPLLSIVLLATGCSKTINQPTMETKNPQIGVSAECEGSDKCIYTPGKDLLFKVVISNKGSVPIGFPLKFKQRTGPVVKLVNNITDNPSIQKEFQVPTSPADFATEQEFTTIEPGKSVSVDWVLHPVEMDPFEDSRNKEINITAEITIASKIKLKDEVTDFTGKTDMHIYNAAAIK